MAAIKRNGIVQYAGGGKHADKRDKRKRTRGAARRAAINESRG